MVGGLKPIPVLLSLTNPPAPLFYTMNEADGSVIGAVQGKHTDNHYLTPEAASVLWRMAASYSVEQRFKVKGRNPITKKLELVAPPVLHLNDASLVWGGLFDAVDSDWEQPHEEHRRGTVVDVRANTNVGAIPAKNFKAFEKMAMQYYGVDAKIHHRGWPSQHYHVRLLNRKE